MLTLGSKIVLTKDELNKLKREAHDKAYEEYTADRDEYRIAIKKELKEEYIERLEDRDDKIKDQKKTIKNLTRQRDDALEEVDVLEKDRDDVREVVAKKIELEDLAATLDATKEALEKQTKRLTDRETKLESKEEGQYKKGYADGVADGVRKINEITQEDRNNAMKIAMVAASSHTPVANMKEAMDVSRQLTAGTQDSESN